MQTPLKLKKVASLQTIQMSLHFLYFLQCSNKKNAKLQFHKFIFACKWPQSPRFNTQLKSRGGTNFCHCVWYTQPKNKMLANMEEKHGTVEDD